MKTRVYTVGNPDTHKYVTIFWHNGVEFSFDAEHLAYATKWQNKVQAVQCIQKLERDAGGLPEGVRLLAFDCEEVVNP